MRHLLNFASGVFLERQTAQNLLAFDLAFDSILSFTPEKMQRLYPEFCERHKAILSQQRGAGFWLWKPFLVHQMLTTLPIGDKLIYLDSGIVLERFPAPLFDLLQTRNQIFFNIPLYQNRQWCKRDVFQALGADTPEFWDSPQIKAQAHLWRVCPESREKSAEWLRWCLHAHLLNDDPSVSENFPEFIEHRHDQAILSILVKKWGNEIFRDPTHEGDPFLELFPNSPYPRQFFALGAPGGQW